MTLRLNNHRGRELLDQTQNNRQQNTFPQNLRNRNEGASLDRTQHNRRGPVSNFFSRLRHLSQNRVSQTAQRALRASSLQNHSGESLRNAPANVLMSRSESVSTLSASTLSEHTFDSQPFRSGADRYAAFQEMLSISSPNADDLSQGSSVPLSEPSFASSGRARPTIGRAGPTNRARRLSEGQTGLPGAGVICHFIMEQVLARKDEAKFVRPKAGESVTEHCSISLDPIEEIRQEEKTPVFVKYDKVYRLFALEDLVKAVLTQKKLPLYNPAFNASVEEHSQSTASESPSGPTTSVNSTSSVDTLCLWLANNILLPADTSKNGVST